MSAYRDSDDACGLAALYSLGALHGDELWEFREHLAGCGDCADELDGFDAVTAELGFAADSVSPSPILRDRLLDAITEAGEPAPSPFDRPGDEWRETASPGVRFRVVSVDEVERRVLAVVRADAGAVYRRHRHAGLEEMFMLEGDLRFGERVYVAGDYVRSEGGSEHETSETRGGCSFLLRASLDDGLMA